MVIQENGKKGIFIKHMFATKNTLQQKNKERIKKGLRPLTFADLIGYNYREAAIKDEGNMFFNANEDLTKIIEHEGYVTREAAYIDHKKYFTDFEQNKILGLCNDNFVYEKSFNNDTKDWRMGAKEKWDKNESIERDIISLSEEHTNLFKQGLISQEQILNITNNAFKSYLKDLGIDVNNVNYNITYHSNTENLHCHIDWYEKQQIVTGKKLDLEQAKKKFHSNLAKKLNAELNLRNYQQIVIDYNFLKKYKESIPPMNKKMYLQLFNNPAKRVGFIKDENLKNELYDYVNNFIESTTILDEIKYNVYESYNYKKNVEKDKQGAIDYAKNYYDNLLMKSRNRIANEIYLMIKKDNEDNLIKVNIEEENKYEEQFNNQYNNFNKKISIRRMQYILNGRLTAKNIMDDMLYKFTEQLHK